MSRKIVIGSGISVLGFLENTENYLDYEIYDKNNYIGGHAYSHKIESYYFDEGAHISHSKNIDFLNYINAHDEKRFKKFKSKVTNFYLDKKIGYPIQLNIYDLKLGEKIKFLLDIFKRNNKKKLSNYYEWLVMAYGKFLAEKYYKAYTLKYWRTNPEEMSVDWIKGRLVDKNIIQSLKSIFFKVKKNNLVYDEFRYPNKNGFFDFFKDKYLKYRITKNYKVESIDVKNKKIYFSNGKEKKFDHLISSIPLDDYKKILVKPPEHILEILNSLKCTKLITYNFKLKKRKNFYFHWCYFYDLDIPISRMSILNNFKNNNDDYYLVQAEVFVRSDELIDISKCDKLTKNHIIKFFNLQNTKDVMFEKKIIIEKAYPIPLIGQKEKINLVKNWLENNSIYQVGLYANWEFMWSDQSFYNGKEIAEKINNLM